LVSPIGKPSQKALRLLSFSECPDLHYNDLSLDCTSPPDAMPANRPNLTLDEQSFQGLLSAAFIIQEHNDRLKLAGQTAAEPQASLEPEASICPHCGAPKAAAAKPAEGSRCESCGLDEFRPGERLQHNWASMWLMSQEQRLWPERSPEIREGVGKGVPPLDAESKPRAQAARDFAASGILALPVAKEVAPEPIAQEETAIIEQREPGKSVLGKAAPEGRWITEATDDFPREGLTPENLTQEELRSEGSDLAVQPFQLSASEDSAPVVHSQGDPSLAVWVDPHTALYYCPGEEQYGKTTDGRFSPQREAQMDRFEPASRSACE